MRDNAFAVARLLCGVIFVHRGRIFASSRHRIGPFSMEAAWGSRWVIETPHETVRAASPDLYKMPLISVVGNQGQNVMHNGFGVVEGNPPWTSGGPSSVQLPHTYRILTAYLPHAYRILTAYLAHT